MAVSFVDLVDDAGKKTVVLESRLTPFSKAISELQSPEAKRQAIAEANARGVPDARLEPGGNLYPVEEDGKIVINSVTQKIAGYRYDYPVTGRLV